MQFIKKFSPQLVVESPGRINLIGEHTDYNLGYVLPTAIKKKITLKFAKNGSDSKCEVYSYDLKRGVSFDLDNFTKSDVGWENYIFGVIHEISKKSDKLKGFNCTIESYMPTGSGISSSAALECGFAYGLNELFNLGLNNREIVELTHHSEHNYVGTKCGIMDQFASVMSKEGHVILLDCRSLEHTYIPMTIAPYKLVLLNTNVSHNLVTSEYNTRSEECEQGVAIIKTEFPEVVSLRDVTETMLQACKPLMDAVIYKRCEYVLEENNRVLEAVEALKENDLRRLGQLMYKTHKGLRYDYEVSCVELDFLVDFSKQFDAVLGARVMGGGFGGCTINLVHEDTVDTFIEEASAAYFKEFNIKLTAFEALPSEGTSIIYP
ncbi:galactokinase [Spongiimicrobium sp. 3-5]|uniref:galactokinase n=1 Tax=Spongiimicrobium sp. 3-5 TaxID=3332596 RepID=UPI00397FDB62